ncbi:hypothetical protein PGTUg99_028475 [Puccinia graminis f. sp. tritici]|uniref:Uncharacterized protein n=1 Tax=Puccinia graminis f. sp. tritici TaxID=56615 RepID=A0A5B0Q994_PUCGR|nr:hypothetical protein PGTUg99_028475 [Puccinia graminis f. sp. tritici]
MTNQPSTTELKTKDNSSSTALLKTAPGNDWSAIRKSWLQPNVKNDEPRPSSSSDQAATTSNQLQKKNPKRLEKIDKMLADYDQASRLGHSNPKPMLSVVDFAFRLTDEYVRHPAPIPLSQAVSVLYRSWFHDGTIPEFHLEKMKDADDTEQEQLQG